MFQDERNDKKKVYYYRIVNVDGCVSVEVWMRKNARDKSFCVRKLGNAKELHEKLNELELGVINFKINIK